MPVDVRLSWAAALCLAIAGIPCVVAQGSVPMKNGRPDFSGYWELRFDSTNVPPAAFTASAAPAVQEARGKDLEAIRACTNVGMPALMADRAPLDIRHGASQIGIVARSPSSVRYIYLDDRGHPDKDELEETTNGHSIGRWDGDSLIVDTIGFGERGITAIPGGGRRTAASHLVERFRLLDGERLEVTSTWDDRAMFSRPHTYAFLYYSVRNAAEPRVFNCLPNDPVRSKFLLESLVPAR
jgi:hypothetical protein